MLAGGSYSWLRTRRKFALVLMISTLPALLGPYIASLLPGAGIIEVSPGVYESNQVHVVVQQALRYATIAGTVLAALSATVLVSGYLARLRRDRSDEPSELP